jgi:RHS repeat-associated protein
MRAAAWLVLCSGPTIAHGAPPIPVAFVFYHADHLGSTNVTTDAEGRLVSETAYYPYGAPRHEQSTASSDPRYRFSDKERDDESDLHYFEARYYHASIGRFISFDNGAKRVDVTGPYAYGRNNPLTYIDTRGTDPTHVSEEASTGAKTKANFEAVVKHTAEGIPKVVTDTNTAAQGLAAGKGPAFISPDPDERSKAAGEFGGDVAGEFAGKGAEKLVDEIKQHAHLGVLIALGASYGGLAYGLALSETDLPVPTPGIPVADNFELKPSIDLSPINGEEDKYVPGFGLRATFSNGPFTQYAEGAINPDTGVSGGAGVQVNIPYGKVGASVQGGENKGVTVGATVTITP